MSNKKEIKIYEKLGLIIIMVSFLIVITLKIDSFFESASLVFKIITKILICVLFLFGYFSYLFPEKI